MTSPNGFVSSSDIFAADDIRVEDVEVSEWGGMVRLRQLPTHEMTTFLDENFDSDGVSPKDYNFVVRMLSRTMVDGEGERLFEDDEHADKVLGKKSWRVIQGLCERAIELNRLTDAEVDEAKKD